MKPRRSGIRWVTTGVTDANGSTASMLSAATVWAMVQADFAGDEAIHGGSTPESSSGAVAMASTQPAASAEWESPPTQDTSTATLRSTGTVFGSAKDFKIDHPLDPANKYLVHTSVESSEMMNIYSGNVVTDELGIATVTLPDWFQAEKTPTSAIS